MCSIIEYLFIDMIKLNYKRKNYYGVFESVVVTVVFGIIMLVGLVGTLDMTLVESCVRQKK